MEYTLHELKFCGYVVMGLVTRIILFLRDSSHILDNYVGWYKSCYFYFLEECFSEMSAAEEPLVSPSIIVIALCSIGVGEKIVFLF